MLTIDTNILVYAFDVRYPEKQTIAQDVMLLVGRMGHPIGLQAVGELQNALRRKLGFPIWRVAEEARSVLHSYASFHPTARAADGALDDIQGGRLKYWDALLVRSAAEHGCTAMFSEDMQDGSRLAGVEIVNPFGATGLSDRARELLTL